MNFNFAFVRLVIKEKPLAKATDLDDAWRKLNFNLLNDVNYVFTGCLCTRQTGTGTRAMAFVSVETFVRIRVTMGYLTRPRSLPTSQLKFLISSRIIFVVTVNNLKSRQAWVGGGEQCRKWPENFCQRYRPREKEARR